MTTSRGTRSRWGAAALAAMLLVGTPAVAGADGRHQSCTPGAAGVGDAYFPTYGNGGYDVDSYDLDITYDPATDRLDGEASIRAKATETLCSFNLDLVGLDVTRVEVDHRDATWTRQGQELIITPRHPLRAGHRFSVEVEYGGVPVAFEIPGFGLPAGFMATPDGAIVAGQPEVATAWFPVNDHPIDKASYSFDVTVPDGYEVVANGVLGGQRTRHGWTTWRWDAREPMASYLATIDIGAWDVTTWRTDTGLRVYDAVDSAITGGLRAEIDSSLSRQDEVIDLLSDAFGPYPFRTAGGIVDNHDDLFFALETQTRSVYSKYFWLDGDVPVNGDSVVAHEMAHQWFGDDLALARWQDIWLNEGFATYAEWLWAEYEGQGTPDEIFQSVYDAFPADRRVLVGHDRGSRGHRPLRRSGVLPRGDDRPRPPPSRRRRRVLGDRPRVGRGEQRGQRHDRRVHRAGRGDLGPAARRPVHDVAVHPRATRPHCGSELGAGHRRGGRGESRLERGDRGMARRRPGPPRSGPLLTVRGDRRARPATWLPNASVSCAQLVSVRSGRGGRVARRAGGER